MKIYHSFVDNLPWHNMETDWDQLFFTSGRGQFNAGTNPGGDEYAAAAFAKDSSIAILYMPTYRKVGVNMYRFRVPVTVSWLDPSDGTYFNSPVKYQNQGMNYFIPPAFKNKGGFDDWVLVLKENKK